MNIRIIVLAVAACLAASAFADGAGLETAKWQAAIAALSAPAVVALPEALSGASSRWILADNGRRIVWDVAHDARLPHADSFEMSGLRASLIFSYSVAADRSLSLGRRMVWPALRVQPNNTHGSFIYDFAEDKMPRLTADGKPCGEVVDSISFDGVWCAESHSADGSLRIVRRVFPSVDNPAAFELVEVENAGGAPRGVGFSDDFADYRLGCTGYYEVRAQAFPSGVRTLATGEKGVWTLRLSARRVNEPDFPADGAAELASRRRRVEELTSAVVLETGIPELDAEFRFAKIRAGESIFSTRTGALHSPGGSAFYAATWCNDQVEYAGPWFAFTGDELALEASMNAYRHYIPFMGPRYDPIPSSVVAEGLDYWNGQRDRGDAAMYAYGAARFVLAHPEAELVQLVSFGCGVDAITADEVRSILESHGRLYTQIKIDEIQNLGAVKIRLRSLLGAMEERAKR